MRYAERNSLRAEMVDRAEDWRWASLWRRLHGSAEQRAIFGPWPVAKPRRWAQLVNEPQHETEVQALRKCVARGQPFGSDSWVAATADELGLQFTLRRRGRPPKPTETKFSR